MKAGLLGRQLGHSLSPQIHRFFGDYDYALYAREPEEVADFVRSFLTASSGGFLNVTIPYKVKVAELCDRLSPLAQRLGNVNFVRLDQDGSLYGDNTDYSGFARLLDSTGASASDGVRAAVLGAGGAAATAKAVLEDRGYAVEIVRRGELPSDSADLIVNATPVGMFPKGDEVRLDIAGYPNCRTVLDLVYNPSPTRLVREARACGKTAEDGFVMLVAQAYRAFKLSQGAAEDDAPAFVGGNLYLYGPPASGKSTWARRLSIALDVEMVDLDAEIVSRAGRTIPEIFAAEGEAAFRRLEGEELARVAARTGRIVALGGGALLNAESRRIAEASGRVVFLDCGTEELVRRARLSADRPLLADDCEGRLRRLLAARRDHYASFSRRVVFG